MIPQQLNAFCFENYYTDCIMDGMDNWDALWYCINYLPTRTS